MRYTKTILSSIYALALAISACGCREATETTETGKRDAPTTAKQPEPKLYDGPSRIAPTGKAIVAAVVSKLTDPGKWERISRAASRRAVEEWDKTLANPMTHIRAGDKALSNGQTDLSIDCFQRAIDLAPKNAEALRGMAMAVSTLAGGQSSLMETRRLYRRAARIYRKIIELAPGDETARFNLGVALMRSGNHTEADEIFRPLLASKKLRTEVTFNLAVVMVSQGKLKQAEALLKELIRSSRTMGASDMATAYAHLGEVLSDLEDTSGALEAYKEAASLASKDVAIWLNLATAARAHGSYGYAITATRKAAELSPFNAEIHLRLGNVLLELHRATREDRFLDEAVEAWKSSLKVDPGQSDLQRRVDIYSRPTSARTNG